MSVTQVIVPGYNSAILENENLWRADQASPNPISGVTLGDDIQQNTSELTVYATIPCGEHSIKISSRYYNSRSYYQVDEYDGSTFVRNLVPSSFEYGTPFGYWSNISLAFGIDNDGHLGYVSVCEYSEHESPNHYWVLQKTNIDRANLYNLLSQVEPPVTYNWQSVPSISGKNGILSLAQIKDEYINEGESVSGASADHFTNLSTENRVDVLINDALPAPEIGGTTVTVEYTIPSLSIGSYEYCKLVAKKNSIPEGPEDGDKIINIDPSLASIVVRGLDELSTYYFVIFIEDDQGNTASSEPMDCVTDDMDVGSEVFEYTGSIQEYTIPRTGFYSLETWGAQGQGDGSARGGYGAYSYGEVLLNQGDKLYIGVGGQNGYNGGGNFASGSIRNITIPNSGQAILFDESLWNADWGGQNYRTPTTFRINSDVLDTPGITNTDYTPPSLLWERNGVQCYVYRDAKNSTFGGYRNFSFVIYDNGVLVAGDPNVNADYNHKFAIGGFHRPNSDYNSNVTNTLQQIGLAFGVNDESQLGYITIVAKRHQGYYQGAYVSYDWYESKYGQENSHNINRAKLYDALIKASQ